jgi:hypothetical protein
MGGFPPGAKHPLEGPLLVPNHSALPLPENTEWVDFGTSPLRRKITLTQEFLRAIKNCPAHKPNRLFSPRCCAKNTQPTMQL